VLCVCFQVCLFMQRVKLLADFLQIKNSWVILAKRTTNYSRGPDGRFQPAITVASTTSGTSTPLSTLPSLSSSPSSITLTLASVDQRGSSGTTTPIYPPPPPPPSTPLLPANPPTNIITQPRPQSTDMADRRNDELFAGEDDDALDPRDFLKRVQR
jgi:hypothetical protein